MKFDELDRRMRVFETAYDLSVLPGIYMVVRLDGRSFTQLPGQDVGGHRAEGPAQQMGHAESAASAQKDG